MNTIEKGQDVREMVSKHSEQLEFIELADIRPVAQALAFGFKAGAGIPMSKGHTGDLENVNTTADPVLLREIDNLNLKNDEADFERDDRFLCFDVNFIATITAYILGTLIGGALLISFKPKQAVIDAHVGADGDLEDFDREFIARKMTSLGMLFPRPKDDFAYTFAPIGLLAIHSYAIAIGLLPRLPIWSSLYEAIREFGRSDGEAGAAIVIVTSEMVLHQLISEAETDARKRTFVDFWNLRERLAACEELNEIMGDQP